MNNTKQNQDEINDTMEKMFDLLETDEWITDDYKKTAFFTSELDPDDDEYLIVTFLDNGDKFRIHEPVAETLTNEDFDDRELLCKKAQKIN